MSGYGSLRKRTHEAAHGDPAEETRCAASGCPCRGVVSLEGSRFLCTAHASIPADRWPMISERLRDHLWLIEFIGEMQKMDRQHGNWRDFARQFWQGTDDFCIPAKGENEVPYQNRMRGELLHRCGLTAKRPEPRLPQERAGKFGNAGGLLGSRA
jgi:hypothetical protein